MKFPPIKPVRMVIDCAILIAVHAILLGIMAHTHVIENVMASQFSRWELALILAFFVVRTIVYFLIPPILVALLVREALRRIPGRISK